MATFSIAFFLVSLLLLVVFFTCKYAELRRGAVFFSSWRDGADKRSLELKVYALSTYAKLEHLPSLVIVVVRFSIHALALLAARLARVLEEKAHWLADYVSHKRGFERREVRSEFLKKIREVKSGGGTLQG